MKKDDRNAEAAIPGNVSGVKEGELILAHPDDSIKEGIAVRVR